MCYLFKKLVHVISHLVFCIELLGWLFFVLLPEKSGLKTGGVQGSFSWLVLPKLALLCVLQPSDISHHLIFRAISAAHWGKKTQQAHYEVD